VFTSERPDYRRFAAMAIRNAVVDAHFVHREETYEKISLLVATAIVYKNLLIATAIVYKKFS
jgi:hypothetical protein